ncbi:MAG: MFS transporter [Opitutaceae bacterium]
MSEKTSNRSNLILASLFFFLWSGWAMWAVTFSNVLRAHGMERFIEYAFALTAAAAIVSPLIAGAIADRSVAPARLVRWLSWGAGLFIGLCFLSIDLGWGSAPMLIFIFLFSVCQIPVSNLLTTIVLNTLDNPTVSFGPLRMWGTIGWAVSCWFVSWVLHADTSPAAGYAGAVVTVAMGFLAYLLPSVTPLPQPDHIRTWKEMLGLDALELLRNRDHRAVFLASLLFAIPIAAVNPFTPLHLAERGSSSPAALMSLGQVSEMICLFTMAGFIARVRLKWVFLIGIFFGIARFALFTLDSKGWLIAGISLHGPCFTLFFVTGQIYLAERIEKHMQSRAQALLSLCSSGIGNLAGYLLTGWWRKICMGDGVTAWPVYWLGLSIVSIAVGAFFYLSYHGIYSKFLRSPKQTAPSTGSAPLSVVE